ncbi:hypothetical protein BMS3Abin02_00646 [bacterium BMS3Abin02]|nr:hypothetical protein BMS3Abin02_00646 [bacterium BMS3Abin02]HDL49590.1 hypothetical protein [Actinomycetota bacterium]
MNPVAAKKPGLERSTLLLPTRIAAAVALAVSVGVFVLVGLIAPDHGPTRISMRQGIALAAVFAAPPIGVLISPVNAASMVALGGAMFVAGAATTPGGNLLGPIMMAPGLLLLLVGASHRPPLTAALIGRFLLYAIALVVGVVLALGTGVLTGLGALLVAAVVASSTRWRTDRDIR